MHEALTDEQIMGLARSVGLDHGSIPDDYADAIGIPRGRRYTIGDVKPETTLAFARAIEGAALAAAPAANQSNAAIMALVGRACAEHTEYSKERAAGWMSGRALAARNRYRATLDQIEAALPAPSQDTAPARAGGATPRVDALTAAWDDDGATRGSAYIEMRDLARELELEIASLRVTPPAPQAAPVQAQGSATTEDIITLARRAAAQHGHTLKETPAPETVEMLVAFYKLAAHHAQPAEQAAPVQASLDEAIDDVTDWLDYEFAANDEHVRNSIRCLRGARMAVAKATHPAQPAEQAGEDARDAARYRWLRDAGATFYSGLHTPQEQKHHVCEWAMDAAIDAAIRSLAGKEGA